MKFFSDFFVTVFYIGRIPLAPGTFSSLFSVIIWFILFKAANPIFLVILTIILFFLGVLASTPRKNNIIVKITKKIGFAALKRINQIITEKRLEKVPGAKGILPI